MVDDATAARQLATELASRYPDERFIVVVTADEGDDLPQLLDALEPIMTEGIYTSARGPASVDGHKLATRAAGHGKSYDFIFEVERLGDAIQYGVTVFDHPSHGGWEGTAILVPGHQHVIDEARQRIAELFDPAR